MIVKHVFNVHEENWLRDVEEIGGDQDGDVTYPLLFWDFDSSMWFPASMPLDVTMATRFVFVRTLGDFHLRGFGTTLHVAQDIPDPLQPKEALANAASWRKLIAQRPKVDHTVTVVFYWKVRSHE